MMAQSTSSDKSPEERLEDIKEMANQITMSIQSEMANLLSYVIPNGNEEIDNKLRKKRSVETPMDSSQLVMRLLKHIKSNNEYQNIAIEKMMTAQEIADKYGINFTPDTETLSDLAMAANEQAKEMSSILKDAINLKNITQAQNASEPNEEINTVESLLNTSAENLIDSNELNDEQQQNATDPIVTFEIPIEGECSKHRAASHYNHYEYYPVETQIPPPHHHHNAPVSQRPNFYEFVNPPQEYYCSMEPTTTIILSNEELEQAEPELVAEEYEETLSSKVFINYEEAPDVSTVNHVTSYTISEKAHFRNPHIESLPQQMQYYFFLM